MAYRMTVRSNPKLLIVPAVILGLGAIAVSLFTAGPFWGVAGLVVGGYIAYILIRFVRKQLASSVQVQEEAAVLDLYGEEQISVAWADVSHAGTATDTRGRASLFLYREDQDKLLVIPDEFERFPDLVGEVKARLGSSAAERSFLELSLGLGETVKDRLRTVVGRPRVVDPEAEPEADPETEPEPKTEPEPAPEADPDTEPEAEADEGPRSPRP